MAVPADFRCLEEFLVSGAVAAKVLADTAAVQMLQALRDATLDGDPAEGGERVGEILDLLDRQLEVLLETLPR